MTRANRTAIVAVLLLGLLGPTGTAHALAKKGCPKLKFRPDPVKFSKVPIGELTFTNVSLTNLSKTESADISSFSVGAAPFGLDRAIGDSCKPGELSPGNSCSVDVTCDPPEARSSEAF